MNLVIGYGNPLRTDDAIGQRIAQIMEHRLSHEAVKVTITYQLTPELVEHICDSTLVVFIDAHVGATPGRIVWEFVEPHPEAELFTHNVSPGALLDAAHKLYGVNPSGILISITGADFEYGSDLSPELRRMLPSIADQIESIIRTNLTLQMIHWEENNHA